MNITVKVDVNKACNKTKLVSSSFLKSMEANSKLVARMAAFQLHKSTLPETFSMPWDKAFVKMKSRIESDVKSAYATKQDNGWQGLAFKLIRDYVNGDRAKKWYSNYKTGGLSTLNERTGVYSDYEEEFDRMRGIPRKANEKEYLDYRKQNNYSIPKGVANQKTLAFVTEDKRKKLLNKRLKTAGLAKAGWKACYHLAGGKGLNVSQMGSEGQNKFPSQINTPYNLFGKTSLGAISLSYNNTGYKGKLINNIRYMEYASEESFVSTAAEITEKYMKILFELRKKSWKSKFKKSA